MPSGQGVIFLFVRPPQSDLFCPGKDSGMVEKEALP